MRGLRSRLSLQLRRRHSIPVQHAAGCEPSGFQQLVTYNAHPIGLFSV